MMVIVLDPGHGETTPGKRSPDGQFREYRYCRDRVTETKQKLESLGYTVYTTVSDDTDVPLRDRCKYVNQICDKYGKDNTILVSFHCNAAGNGSDWLSARGFSVFVSNNASSRSKDLANLTIDVAEEKGLYVRKYSHNQRYWKQNLAICRDTKCAAILTESLLSDAKVRLKQ